MNSPPPTTSLPPIIADSSLSPSLSPTASTRLAHAKTTTSLALLVATPILLALPPRKLDLYAFSLTAAFALSANHLAREHTGLGILQRLDARRWRQQKQNDDHVVVDDAGAGVGAGAGDVEREKKRESERRAEGGRLAVREESAVRGPWLGADGRARLVNTQSIVAKDGDALRSSIVERRERREATAREEEMSSSSSYNSGVAGMARNLWLGGEGEDWKSKRLQEEKDALEEGKGYGDIIMEQIWQVWNWEKKTRGEEND